MIGMRIQTAGLDQVRASAASLKPEMVATVGGRAVSEVIQQHFSELENSRPNKLGGKRTNFWQKAKRSTSVTSISGNTATVSVNHLGIAQRYFGGTIRPRAGKKFLTIPAAPEAYGQTASQVSDLQFGFAENRFGNLAPALIKDPNKSPLKLGRKRKDGTRRLSPGELMGGKVMFWLTKKVYQRADPSVLPTTQQMEQAAHTRMESYIARKFAGGK